MIPYDDILRYPTDWPDISQTREQTVSAERGENKEDRAVQAQLDRPLPELQFDGVGFSDVIDFLRDVSGANIFVNWKSLEAAGVDRNAPVTARLRKAIRKCGGGTYCLRCFPPPARTKIVPKSIAYGKGRGRD